MIKTGMQPIPEGFAREMKALLGDSEASLLLSALDRTPSVSIRLNNAKCSAETRSRLESEAKGRVEWCADGLRLGQRPDFFLDPLLHAGVYYVQEAASMVYQQLAGDILAEENGRLLRQESVKVLDLCAAPGGKSTALLNALQASGVKDYALVANEYDRKRANLLAENIQKWGNPNVIVTNTAAGAFGKLESLFDIVAVDAPCSGEGMMRREPVARSQWRPELIESCAALQRDIVADVLPALKPGGYLIYSTCTFNTRENESNVAYFAEKFGLEAMGNSRRFMPHREECEGLFAAVFRKHATEGADSFRFRGNKKTRQPDLPKELDFLKGQGLIFTESGTNVLGIPESIFPLYETLQKQGIRIITAGIPVAEKKGNTLVANSRMVLSTDLNIGKLPAVELNLEQALAYLRRETLSFPTETPKGLITVRYAGYPLGLMKNLGPRANNLFPTEWRILRASAPGQRPKN